MKALRDFRGAKALYRFVLDNSVLLILGTLVALIWANVSNMNDTNSYRHFVEFDLLSVFHHAEHAPETALDNVHLASAHGASGANSAPSGAELSQAHPEEGGHSHGLTLHFIVNDILMAIFFAIAAKEVWESMLPGGALSNIRKAITPLLATIGGILGPAVLFLFGTFVTGTTQELGGGWAIPCATDIAFSYLVARVIFGSGHPAIAFLLLLAIADDAAGLMILAVFYPQAAIQPQWLLLTLGALLLTMVMRRRWRVQNHWYYIAIPGAMSWISFYMANIHPALGLCPIIPLLPHAHTDLGIFAREELKRHDTLNEFEHFWKTPVEYILGLFGLMNAGVILSSLGTGTYLVLLGLLVGKPLGILMLTLFAERVLRLEKPAGMTYYHVATVGMVAGIGFTVALFVSVAAFREPGVIQDSVKMGALLSFAAAPLALLMGRVFSLRTSPAKAAASQFGVPHQA